MAAAQIASNPYHPHSLAQSGGMFPPNHLPQSTPNLAVFIDSNSSINNSSSNNNNLNINSSSNGARQSFDPSSSAKNAATLGSMPTLQNLNNDRKILEAPQTDDMDVSLFENVDADASLESGTDVTKMDTASLQDVIQYSGVDLKEEAENILRGHDSFAAASYSVDEDARLSYENYVNVASLKDKIARNCKRVGLKAYHDDCLYVVAFAVKNKVAKLIEATAQISRHRMEQQRLRFKIKVDNDPAKQLWLVHNFYRNLLETPESQKKESASGMQLTSFPGVNSDPSSSMITKNQTALPVLLPGAQTSTAGISTGGGGGALSGGIPGTPLMGVNAPSAFAASDASATANEMARKKAKKALSSKGSGSSSFGREREDVAIKTKLANVTALAALGIPQKSWMSSGGGSMFGGGGIGAGSGGSKHSDSSASKSGSSLGGATSWKSQYNMQLSSNVSDKEFVAQIMNRTIKIHDLLFYMRNDRYFSRTKTYLAFVDCL